MQKVIYCFIALLFYCFIAVTPVGASDSWKSLPPNTCPSYPVISACNLTYIMETNVSTLGNLISGANAGVAQGIGLLYQVPPVSGRDYLAYIGSRFHVPGTPTTAYAAAPPVGGVGYNSLGPVLKIWVVMRNLAYLVFAVIFIVIGIMILIRSKIDPKTTVDIQNALPKIVLALVLVTFSYAIAGFLIDIMYITLALVLTITGAVDVSVLSSAKGITTKELGTNILSHNLFWGFFADWSIWDAIGSAGQAISTLLYTFITGTQSQGIGGAIGSMLTGVAGGIAALIIAIAILWALFKTWLSLLSAYANIILGIIFAPLQLMIDAIPGQNQLDGWIRNMLANLLAFPTVLTMILIGVILARSNDNNPGGVLGFSPPLIGASNQQAIQSLIGIGIILTIPKAVEILQETLKAPKSKWGSAWGEAVGWSAGLTTSPIRGQAYDTLYKQGTKKSWLSPFARGIIQAGYNQKWWGSPPPPP